MILITFFCIIIIRILQIGLGFDAIAIRRFQDMFVHGQVRAFDEKNGLALTEDGAPGANQDPVV